MIDKLFQIFGSGSIHRINMVINIVSQIVKAFEQEFANDKNSKNAAIDTIISLLQQHKDFAPSQTEPPKT